MGSLPDSKYIVQTDGYYFVESHDVDPSKGYISVSAKGIVNGLSNQPNDGCDFGPDTYNPNYTGSGIPYTQTSGLQEYADYVKQFWQKMQGSSEPVIYLQNQRYSIYTDLVLPAVTGAPISTWEIRGTGRYSSEITLESGCVNGIDAHNLQPYGGSGANLVFSGLTIRANATGIDYHINAELPAGSGDNEFYSYNIQIAGNSTHGVGISNMQTVTIDQVVNSDISSEGNGFYTFGGVIDTIVLKRQKAFGNIGVNCSSLNMFVFDSIYSDTAIVFNQPVNIVKLQGENHNQITYQGAANIKYILLDDYTYISPTLSSPFYVNTGYTPTVLVDGFYYNIPSGTVDFFGLGSGGSNPSISVMNNVLKLGSGTITTQNISVATPSVPASGTPQTNDTGHAVNVYLYGGTVTVIDYTPAGGSATQVGTSGPATVRLNPGDSITLTYSAAPTWNWVAV